MGAEPDRRFLIQPAAKLEPESLSLVINTIFSLNNLPDKIMVVQYSICKLN